MDSENPASNAARIETACKLLEFSTKALRKAINKTHEPVITPKSHEDCSGLLAALNAAVQVAAAAHAALTAAQQVSDAADAAVYAAGQLWFACEFHDG